MFERVMKIGRPLLVLAAWCCGLGAVFAAFLGLSSFIAPDYWLSDNMSFFLWQFLYGGIGGTLCAIAGFWFVRSLRGAYRLLVVIAAVSTMILAVVTGLRTVENTAPLFASSADFREIKIVSINLEALFLGDPVLTGYLEDIDPDIIVLQETLWPIQKMRWHQRGVPIGGPNPSVYPEWYSAGNLGELVVFSRFPIEKTSSRLIPGVTPPGASVHYNGDREILSMSVNVDGQAVDLIAVHPDSPRTNRRWQNKRAYFEAMDADIAELRQAGADPLIVVGDWNSSPWSARFHQSLEENDLVTAYPDGVPQVTRYFFDYRLRWILGSPVDQFAVSKDIGIVNVSLGPHIGSDHRPLLVTLQLPEQAKD